MEEPTMAPDDEPPLLVEGDLPVPVTPEKGSSFLLLSPILFWEESVRIVNCIAVCIFYYFNLKKENLTVDTVSFCFQVCGFL